MSLDVLKGNFQAGFNAFLPVVSESFEQIFFQPLSATLEILPDSKILKKMRGYEQAQFFMSFNGGETYGHLLAIPGPLALRLYAMMLGEEEPAEEISDEHIDGLKEALQQLAGQLKMNFAESAELFELDGLNAVFSKNPTNLDPPPPNGEGLCANINCTIGGEAYTVQHYCWQTGELAEAVDIEDDREIPVQPVQFSEIGGGANGHAPRNVDMLLDVKLNLTVELGRKSMLISEVLKLGKGSIVELEKSAGEPLFILVNGRKLAEGEVVVVDDHFAIRITHLASPKERIHSLG
ncbi:MAG TPA: flagellar motor switch protein FliN [Calditrichia bacterium]|nr:flagellar motor switch protein FliN [Calditrichota bacterium]HQU70653.1 flagellar motor switch protein FliN [Calditrichia bacterium]HQV30395.1 flagellar motor switch protein FliN [Calditrichia bacterium]